MTEQKMQQINTWLKKVNKGKLEMQEKMVIANATMEMLEKLEPNIESFRQKEQDKILAIIANEHAEREKSPESEELRGEFLRFIRARGER